METMKKLIEAVWVILLSGKGSRYFVCGYRKIVPKRFIKSWKDNHHGDGRSKLFWGSKVDEWESLNMFIVKILIEDNFSMIHDIFSKWFNSKASIQQKIRFDHFDRIIGSVMEEWAWVDPYMSTSTEVLFIETEL